MAAIIYTFTTKERSGTLDLDDDERRRVVHHASGHHAGGYFDIRAMEGGGRLAIAPMVADEGSSDEGVTVRRTARVDLADPPGQTATISLETFAEFIEDVRANREGSYEADTFYPR